MDAGSLLFKGGILVGDSCVWLLVFRGCGERR